MIGARVFSASTTSKTPETFRDKATPVTSDPRLWSVDRLHANTTGHERIARGFAHALGLDGTHHSWADPFPPAIRRPRHALVAAEVAWARTYFTPWIVRRRDGPLSVPSGATSAPRTTMASAGSRRGGVAIRRASAGATGVKATTSSSASAAAPSTWSTLPGRISREP